MVKLFIHYRFIFEISTFCNLLGDFPKTYGVSYYHKWLSVILSNLLAPISISVPVSLQL